ncbi:MAG: L-histidine N(alpha)-methyltransferase, partial [Pseudomonadota bacterium]|nr:L-histidine N(alpha)-methyltransferase [Pseudomonadota bacterium]
IARINGELEGEIPPDAFRHRAVWNDPMSRVEMHLEAVRDVAFTVAGRSFAMAAGETIHTENSHKYGTRDSRLLLRAAGWSVVKEWTDDKERFALILAEAEAPRFAP